MSSTPPPGPPWQGPPGQAPPWQGPPWQAPPGQTPPAGSAPWQAPGPWQPRPPPGPPKAFPRGVRVGSGPIPLRPLSLGDVLDGMFKLFQANPAAILALAAIVVVPVQLVAAFLQRDVLAFGILDAFENPALAPTPTGGDVIAPVLITALANGLVLPLAAGAICTVVGTAYLGGRVSTADGVAAVLPRAGALIGANLLHYLLLLVPLIPGTLVAAAAAQTGATSVAVVAALLIALGALTAGFLVPYFVAVAPAVVLERAGPVTAVRRAAMLIRGRYWPTLGTVIVAGLVVGVLGSVIGFVPNVIGQVVGGSYAWLVVAVGTILSQLAAVPLTAIVATLIYFDGRIRTEGFDLQLLSRELGARGVGSPAPPAAPGWEQGPPRPPGAPGGWPGPAPQWPGGTPPSPQPQPPSSQPPSSQPPPPQPPPPPGGGLPG